MPDSARYRHPSCRSDKQVAPALSASDRSLLPNGRHDTGHRTESATSMRSAAATAVAKWFGLTKADLGRVDL